MKRKIDAGSEALDKGRAFGSYMIDHFIQLVVVGVSATQTYFLVSQIAPQWATWLPVLGVLLMEGGYLFWMWREFEADIADGNLPDVEMNAQEKIANRMVYVTLILSVVTMLAGGFIEITQSDLLATLNVPEFANLLALIAISGIFVLAGIHLFADWRYRRSDPDVALNRVHRMQMRKLRRQQQGAVLKGEEDVTQEEVAHTQQLYTANKKQMGESRANQKFETVRQYGAEEDFTDRQSR